MFDECLEYINKAIDIELKYNSEAISKSTIDKPLLWYVRCVCNLKLYNYDQVQEDYSLLLPFIRMKEGQQMCKFIFGIIILPIEQNRRRLIDSIEGMNDIMDYFEKPVTDTVLMNKHYQL